MASNVDVLFPVQQAIYTLLDGQVDAGVYDQVPEDAPFPYVVVGEATSTPQGAHDRFGARSTVTLHVWSTYRGNAEALGVVDTMMGLLDHQPLTVTGHATVVVRHEQTVTMRDPDGDLRHAVARFAIETEYTA